MLSNFKWFQGSNPWGGGGWVDGGGGGYGCVGECPMYACMHTQMHTHTHARTHARTCMLNMLNMDASMLAAICNFYTCINVCVYMCVHVTCMCMCGGHPPCPQMAPTHLPPPQSRREPKRPKFKKSWTNRDNLILFEDSLPLNIPELI